MSGERRDRKSEAGKQNRLYQLDTAVGSGAVPLSSERADAASRHQLIKSKSGREFYYSATATVLKNGRLDSHVSTIHVVGGIC